MRIGHGYDAHRLASGRRLILGGVDIPFGQGLFGHSDADVLTHAIMDALLGAAGLGDIGVHFPDSDPSLLNISSLTLLSRTGALISDAGYQVENIDATILAQRPRLAPYFPAMRKNLAYPLGIQPDAINIKATTEEGMGFTGAGTGIAAHAVALLRSK